MEGHIRSVEKFAVLGCLSISRQRFLECCDIGRVGVQRCLANKSSLDHDPRVEKVLYAVWLLQQVTDHVLDSFERSIEGRLANDRPKPGPGFDQALVRQRQDSLAHDGAADAICLHNLSFRR